MPLTLYLPYFYFQCTTVYTHQIKQQSVHNYGNGRSESNFIAVNIHSFIIIIKTFVTAHCQ